MRTGRSGWRPDRAAMRERTWAEERELVQRINAAAVELHALWTGGPLEFEALARRRAARASLQSEIDRLYAERRRLVAERSLLRERPPARPSREVWGLPAA